MLSCLVIPSGDPPLVVRASPKARKECNAQARLIAALVAVAAAVAPGVASAFSCGVSLDNFNRADSVDTRTERHGNAIGIIRKRGVERRRKPCSRDLQPAQRREAALMSGTVEYGGVVLRYDESRRSEHLRCRGRMWGCGRLSPVEPRPAIGGVAKASIRSTVPESGARRSSTTTRTSGKDSSSSKTDANVANDDISASKFRVPTTRAQAWGSGRRVARPSRESRRPDEAEPPASSESPLRGGGLRAPAALTSPGRSTPRRPRRPPSSTGAPFP